MISNFKKTPLGPSEIFIFFIFRFHFRISPALPPNLAKDTPNVAPDRFCSPTWPPRKSPQTLSRALYVRIYIYIYITRLLLSPLFRARWRLPLAVVDIYIHTCTSSALGPWVLPLYNLLFNTTLGMVPWLLKNGPAQKHQGAPSASFHGNGLSPSTYVHGHGIISFAGLVIRLFLAPGAFTQQMLETWMKMLLWWGAPLNTIEKPCRI